MEQVLLVMSNLPDAASAHELARKLVEQKLAACVNCLPGMLSVYRWQGAVEEAGEVGVLIKTTQALYGQVEQAIRAAHPYQLPEIIAIPIVAGLPAYLQWVIDETGNDGNA